MLLHSSQKGQGLVEYGIILMLVALVVIIVLTTMGPIVGNMFSKVTDNLQ
jgi:pilus assembly protein Flp/PilA